MKLYMAWYCPFAQRAWLAFTHKGIPFEYIEIDPYEKTDSWLAISRGGGQVPVLEMTDSSGDKATVIDSNRVVEFVDEYFTNTGPSLFPAKATERADAKFWMDFIGKRIIPYMYRFLKTEQSGDYQDDSKNKLMLGITEFTLAMSKTSPFFLDTGHSAIDIAFSPFAYRIDLLLSHYRNFKLPTEGDIWERYQRWFNAVTNAPEFKQTSLEQKDYVNRLIDFYLPYSEGGGQSDVTDI